MKRMTFLLQSLGISVLLGVAIVLLALFYHLVALGRLPEPRPFERVIIFTETGTQLFKSQDHRYSDKDLADILTDESLQIIQENNYELSLAIDRFDLKATEAVRKLNARGIKVWVWPLHPLEDGYWLSTDNPALFLPLFERFRDWTEENDLQIQGIMLDMEPSHQSTEIMKAIAQNEGIGGSIRHLLKRRNPGLYQEAKDYYRQAIELIRQDGFEVSTFNYPYVLDDRIDRDPSIQEMFHIVREASDFDVYMLYRTFFQDSGLGTGVANVISYGQSMHGQSAGIGSYFDSDLTWDQLEEDVRVAARFSPILHIYALEGLIDHRWLESLSTIDLNTPVHLPVVERLSITGYRTFFKVLDLFTGKSLIPSIALFVLVWVSIYIGLSRGTSRPR